MSIGKSVPNLISYLHEFFQNFSQSPAICFELISFGYFIYSEIADKRAPLVSRRAPLPRGRHTPRRRSSIKAAVETASSRSRRADRSRCHHADRLVPRPPFPTAASLHVPPPRQHRAIAAVRARRRRGPSAPRLPRRRRRTAVAVAAPDVARRRR
jgi:hypothetical protein